MTAGPGIILGHLRRTLAAPPLAGESDRQLLRRYAAGGADAGPAFEALLRRHGPMVLGVCRAALRDPHAADDAFQATFLILVRRAGTLRRPDALGPWLFGVARRVCAHARAAALRRQVHERRAAAEQRPTGNGIGPDTAAVVHEEVGRLPAGLRAAVVLCDLEGRTYQEAAERLRLSRATVRGRLARARVRLRARLTRRGVSPLMVPVAPLVPAALTAATTRAAAVVSGRAAGVVSGSVVALMNGGLRSMMFTKLKMLSLSMLAVGFLAPGAFGVRVQPAAEAAASKPATVAVDRLQYGDGTPDGKKSLGGSGPMIRFTAPTDGTKVAGVRIHGARYGTPQAPDERFLVYLLSQDGEQVIGTQMAPYSLFERGPEKWVEVAFPQAVAVPKEFWVSLDFRAGPRKGVYVSYDTSTGGKYSKAGLPGLKPADVDFAGDWMVEVLLATKN